jgi:NAD-dependent deacetylase
VVLFGEMLPGEAVDRLERELETGFDAVFTIGTTSVFPYIAAPVSLAKGWGAPTVEINPGESEVSSLVDLRIRAGAKEALDAIWAALETSPAP